VSTEGDCTTKYAAGREKHHNPAPNERLRSRKYMLKGSRLGGGGIWRQSGEQWGWTLYDKLLFNLNTVNGKKICRLVVAGV